MSTQISIVDFQAVHQVEHRAAFRALNEEWITRFFTLEAIDEAVLADPEAHILSGGGNVWFAQLDTQEGPQIVGTVALKNAGDGVFELTKMAVSPKAQGAGIGARLMQVVIDRFCTLGGTRLYLETNAVLQPAMRLYERHGFVDQGGPKSGTPYARAGVYMIWHPPDP